MGVGKKILESVGTDLTKLVALELGGKNATILHKDTDIDHALPELLRSCYLSSGQRCTSTSIIAVHRSIEQEFIAKFKAATERIIIDHPIDFKQKPFMGPLIDQAAKDTYEKYLELARKNNAEELYVPEIKTRFPGPLCVPNNPLFKGGQERQSFHPRRGLWP